MDLKQKRGLRIGFIASACMKITGIRKGRNEGEVMMSDEADLASDTAQFMLDIALKNNRAAGLRINNPSGLCLNCGAVTGHEKRWCDNDCRDDYIKRLGH